MFNVSLSRTVFRNCPPKFFTFLKRWEITAFTTLRKDWHVIITQWIIIINCGVFRRATCERTKFEEKKRFFLRETIFTRHVVDLYNSVLLEIHEIYPFKDYDRILNTVGLWSFIFEVVSILSNVRRNLKKRTDSCGCSITIHDGRIFSGISLNLIRLGNKCDNK